MRTLIKTRTAVIIITLLGWATSLRAVFGVGDTVVVVGNADMGEIAHRAAEIAEWGKQIESVKQQIDQFNKVIKQGQEMADVVGNPKKSLQSITNVRASIGGLDISYDSQGSAARNRMSTFDSLNRTVGTTMTIDGQTANRDVSLYDTYSAGDSYSDNLRAEIERNNAEQKRIAQQRQALLDEMASRQSAGTLSQADMQQYLIALDALKAKQDASDGIVTNAKQSLDEEEIQRRRDEERQRVADKEKVDATAKKAADTLDAAARKSTEKTKEEIKPVKDPRGTGQFNSAAFGTLGK